MSKTVQEFYCTVSGGGCGGYFIIKINTSLNRVVKIICPHCKHEHQRRIVDGEIKEAGRWGSDPEEEIISPLSAYSKKPRTHAFLNRTSKERDGAVIKSEKDLNSLSQSWLDRFGQIFK